MLGFPLNVAHIILGWIFSILFSALIALGLSSIPTPPMVALMEFFHADADTNVHPLPVSWYFISSSLWSNLCSCTQIMSIFFSSADAVSSGSWFIVFSVLTLNVARFKVCLHFSRCVLLLGSMVVFLDMVSRATTSVVGVSCLSALDVMWFVCVWCCWGAVADFSTQAGARTRGRWDTVANFPTQASARTRGRAHLPYLRSAIVAILYDLIRGSSNDLLEFHHDMDLQG